MKNDLEKILLATCKVMGVSEIEMKGRSRLGHICLARQLYFNIAYENYHTYDKIGKSVGRNHATVLTANNKIIDEMKYYPKILKDIAEIKSAIINIDIRLRNYHIIYNNINISHVL
jgi:chromosomal replication initiation ATPase DnaA